MGSRVSDKSWKHFVEWCRARRLKPLPAHPWTVAAYARWCETRHRFPTLVARIRAIARQHLLSGARPPVQDPTVTRTLNLIEHRQNTKTQRSNLFEVPAVKADRPQPKQARTSGTAAQKRRGMRITPPLVSRSPKK